MVMVGVVLVMVGVVVVEVEKMVEAEAVPPHNCTEVQLVGNLKCSQRKVRP